MATALAYVNELRSAEIDAIASMIPAASRVLEIGAGTGQQAKRLTEIGHAVEAIDLADGPYAGDLVFPVVPYDGTTLPWPDDSFDVVFSSNLLEHVRDLSSLHTEIHRVLRPNGSVVHVVPTHAWRIATTVTSLLGARRPRRHGERGNLLSESWLFRPGAWRRHFLESRWRIVEDRPVGFFYTGTMLFGSRIPLRTRLRLAKYLGSACHVFRLVPDQSA